MTTFCKGVTWLLFEFSFGGRKFYQIMKFSGYIKNKSEGQLKIELLKNTTCLMSCRVFYCG